MGINPNSIFYHSARLAVSSVILQLLGFLYRILLGRLAGPQVIAVHGLVMSAYNVVLSCTLTGIAFSVSRIAAKYQSQGSGRSIIRLISTSLVLFLSLFSLLVIPFGLFRQTFAEVVLGNANTAKALLLLVPCLLLTGFENVHKAYFYGTCSTVPPIISETLEMLLRIGAALILFAAFPDLDIASSAALIVLGMVASEVMSASFLTTVYRFDRRHLLGRDDVGRRQILRDIGAMAVPVSLSTLISRVLSATNTVLIPRTLVLSGLSQEQAMEQFGILSGMTLPMLLLPSAFLSPLVTVLTPRFTAASTLNRWPAIRRKAAKALHVTGLLGIPALTVIVCFGGFLSRLLYHTPQAANHLVPLAFNTFLSFYYVICESVLEGIGQQKRSSILAVVATGFGVFLTFLIGGLLCMGIMGFLVGELSSSFFGVVMSLIWVKRYGLVLPLAQLDRDSSHFQRNSHSAGAAFVFLPLASPCSRSAGLRLLLVPVRPHLFPADPTNGRGLPRLSEKLAELKKARVPNGNSGLFYKKLHIELLHILQPQAGKGSRLISKISAAAVDVDILRCM